MCSHVFVRPLCAAICVLAFELFGCHSAWTQDTSKTTNEFVLKLKEARQKQQQAQESLAKRQSGIAGTTANVDILKYYDYQIANAEERLASGGTFGNEEYQESLEAIRNDLHTATQRSIMDLSAGTKNQLGEADRAFNNTVTAAQRDYKKAIEESRESASRAIATANLEFLFRTNRGGASLVVWNLPVDRKLHSRLSTSAMVRLSLNDKDVWKSKSWKLSTRAARNVMPLPNIMFDSVTIELSKWTGSGCGLSEVEVFIGNENVALSRPCEVSSLETLPIHLDDQHALTDGIQEPTRLGEGYWIPEEKTKAAITIHLTGMKIERPKSPRIENR